VEGREEKKDEHEEVEDDEAEGMLLYCWLCAAVDLSLLLSFTLQQATLSLIYCSLVCMLNLLHYGRSSTV